MHLFAIHDSFLKSQRALPVFYSAACKNCFRQVDTCVMKVLVSCEQLNCGLRWSPYVCNTKFAIQQN